MLTVVRKYNARPSIPVKAAPKYKARTFLGRLLLPKSVDLRPKCSPIFDQGQIGSCTGNALAGALEFLELKGLGQKSVAAEIFDPNVFSSISRLFIYYNERVIGGDVDTDGGATLTDGMRAVNRWGFCREVSWPYSQDNVFKLPTPEIYQEASSHRGITGYQIDNTDLGAMKSCLAAGNPFVFVITIYSSFEGDEVAKTGVVPMPNEKAETILGGHALLCVGYDDAKQAFIFRNSWGANWALNGYAYIPYNYMTDPQLALDMWTIRK